MVRNSSVKDIHFQMEVMEINNPKGWGNDHYMYIKSEHRGGRRGPWDSFLEWFVQIAKRSQNLHQHPLIALLCILIYLNSKHLAHHPTVPTDTYRTSSPQRQHLTPVLSPLFNFLQQSTLLECDHILSFDSSRVNIRSQSPHSCSVRLAHISVLAR